VSYQQIAYARLRELVDDPHTQLIEVLPRAEYEELHLPRALSIPLKGLDETTVAGLNRGKEVVVYCWDGL